MNPGQADQAIGAEPVGAVEQGRVYVRLLHQQNMDVVRLAHSVKGTKTTERAYRRDTRLLLTKLLGREPTAEEVDQVCTIW